MCRNLAVLMFVLLFAAQIGGAQSRTDFNGTWNIQQGQHNFTVLGLSVANLRLDFQGPALRESVRTISPGDGNTFSLRYLIDGAETINEFDGRRIFSRAWRQGDQLVIEWQWPDGKSGIRRTFSGREGGNKRMVIQYFEPGRLDIKTVSLKRIS